jgi:glucose-1-phosphate adenylyltransferase
MLPARVAGSADLRRSMVAAGSRIRGAVEHSVVGPGVVVEEGATVRNCVLLDRVRVGPGVVLENVIADVGAEVTEGEHGAAGAVTLVDDTGAVSATEEFDRGAVLPRGF